MPAQGFVYPNELEVGWSLLIVLYPYITGLVAGAFIVSSLYHVFGIESLKPVSRFSLVTALAFLIVAPLPLQAHLGHPERGFEIFVFPHFTSAMAGFGYIWAFYLILVSVETWLVFRRDIVTYAQRSTGLKRTIYSALTLGARDLSKEAVEGDEKLIKILATVGIPSAFVLHGYVGFIFGSLKANPWWSTPLMPIIFLLSAIVSGMALLIVLYVATTAIRGAKVDSECLRSLAVWLGGFLTLAVTIESLEVVNLMYEQEESWEAIRELLTVRLAPTYLVLQLLVGSVLPLVILAWFGLRQVGARVTTSMIVLSALLILVGVFAMRWNVVIGGQLLSKSLRGFVSYTPTLGGREGVFAALTLMALPFWLFTMIAYFIPPWREASQEVTPDERRGTREATTTGTFA
jgi:Ni/Fe-hydrogenase subunit HybB-like protein